MRSNKIDKLGYIDGTPIYGTKQLQILDDTYFSYGAHVYDKGDLPLFEANMDALILTPMCSLYQYYTAGRVYKKEDIHTITTHTTSKCAILISNAGDCIDVEWFKEEEDTN